jgi:hypothetical protein
MVMPYDSDGDGDVDGSDLADFCDKWSGGHQELQDFATVFGTNKCLNGKSCSGQIRISFCFQGVCRKSEIRTVFKAYAANKFEYQGKEFVVTSFCCCN